MTYKLQTDPPSITCLVCGRTSYHPVDVSQRYCGYCQVFHEQRYQIQKNLRALRWKVCSALIRLLLFSTFSVFAAGIIAWTIFRWQKAGLSREGALCLAFNSLALAVNFKGGKWAWREWRHLKNAHTSVRAMYGAKGETAMEHHFDQAIAALEAAKRN